MPLTGNRKHVNVQKYNLFSLKKKKKLFNFVNSNKHFLWCNSKTFSFLFFLKMKSTFSKPTRLCKKRLKYTLFRPVFSAHTKRSCSITTAAATTEYCQCFWRIEEKKKEIFFYFHHQCLSIFLISFIVQFSLWASEWQPPLHDSVFFFVYFALHSFFKYSFFFRVENKWAKNK